MRIFGYIVLIAVVLLLSACATNPLVRPMDVFLNETGGPYMEARLAEDLATRRRDEAFVRAKLLELEALRALIKEAKGEK
jgi:hypothetical protein